jgi:hypothetical protein
MGTEELLNFNFLNDTPIAENEIINLEENQMKNWNDFYKAC